MVIVPAARSCIILALIAGCVLVASCDGDDSAQTGAQRGTHAPRNRSPFDGFRRRGMCPSDAGVSTQCLEGCLELCNGIDDDCDGTIDEEAGKASCVVAYAESACVDGECEIVRCVPGHLDCNGQMGDGCEVAAEDGRECPQVQCQPGYGDCDADSASCESRLDTPEHCGGCETHCVSPPNAEVQCEDGKCSPMTCVTGYADCDGDAANGCEQRLDSLQHCGACGRVCTKAACEGGVCSSVDCRDKQGFADCDGDEVDCETNLTSDLTHCGGCDNACEVSNPSGGARAQCMDGRCVVSCEPGFGDCDGNYTNGCETALGSVDHCRACGDSCALPNVAEHTCTAGACVIGTCRPNFADCDGIAENGCERDLRSPQNGGMGPCSPDVRCQRLVQASSEFYVCSTPRSWQDARAHCQQQRNGDLAHVPDAATQELIRRQLRERSWIGHTDVRVEGVWVWSYNQRPFWRDSPRREAIDGQFAEWSPGEPNGSGDCGAMYETGLLDDLTCTRAAPYVCETIVDACPEDPDKIDPGQCGCGEPDVDSDRDGFADCADE